MLTQANIKKLAAMHSVSAFTVAGVHAYSLKAFQGFEGTQAFRDNFAECKTKHPELCKTLYKLYQVQEDLTHNTLK